MSFSMRIDWHCECGDPESSHRTTAQGEQCWGHCQTSERRNCNGRGYRPIPHIRRTPAIEAIFDVAISARLPEMYTCDLSTDYQFLMDYDGPFIWVLRTLGTHLYALDAEDGEQRTWQRGYVNGALDYHAHNYPEARYFAWNPGKGELAEINLDTARTLAAVWLAPRAQEVGAG